MTMPRLAGLGALLLLLSGGPAAAEERAPARPVALVYSLTGEAALTDPAGERRLLRLFHRLPAGATVEVGAGSRLALAFMNGRRYELGEHSRVKLGPADLSARSGPVHPLATVPPLPRLEPVADEEQAGLRAGAVRIRAERIAGLYPRGGAATLAGATVLRFKPVAGGGKYRIEVQDRQGNLVFAAETANAEVSVPAEVLQPDTRYHWTVRTLDRAGPVAKGEAGFVTLSSRIVKSREALRKAVEGAGDGASLALLAEVDRALGLWAEARDELRAAAHRSPGDAVLADALAELERRLEEGSSEETGVVIEDVTPESLGARAGLQPGDVLLSWCRTAVSSTGPCLAEGRFDSPFDFYELDLEQAPRGGVKVLGKRAGESTTWALLPGSQAIEVRAVLSEPLASLDQEGRSFAEGRPEDAAERWRAAASQAGDDRLRVWLLSRGVGILADARQWPQVDALCNEAVERARFLDEKIQAQLLKTCGETLQRRGSWEQAEDLYRRSLELDRTAGRELTVAWIFHNLGTMAGQRGDLDDAETLLRQALEILERRAPRSSRFATSLRNLGNVMFLWQDFASAEDRFERALSIQEELAPGGLETARALINLGSTSLSRGNLAAAEGFYRRAKVICERAGLESSEMAKALKNLGVIAARSGDQETAKHLMERALAIEERTDASGAALAVTLQSLGLQAYERADLDTAERYMRRALNLNEKLVPAGGSVALNLQNLGSVALHRGDCAAAEELFQHAYAIRQKHNPDSLDVADSLESLGWHALQCGDLSAAEGSYRRVVAIRERLDSESTSHAMALHDLGAQRQLVLCTGDNYSCAT